MPDITRSTMPPSSGKTLGDGAEELLARFPDVDRHKLLIQLIVAYMLDFRYGNKQEERAACDFLNLLQAKALAQKASK